MGQESDIQLLEGERGRRTLITRIILQHGEQRKTEETLQLLVM